MVPYLATSLNYTANYDTVNKTEKARICMQSDGNQNLWTFRRALVLRKATSFGIQTFPGKSIFGPFLSYALTDAQWFQMAEVKHKTWRFSTAANFLGIWTKKFVLGSRIKHVIFPTTKPATKRYCLSSMDVLIKACCKFSWHLIRISLWAHDFQIISVQHYIFIISGEEIPYINLVIFIAKSSGITTRYLGWCDSKPKEYIFFSYNKFENIWKIWKLY